MIVKKNLFRAINDIMECAYKNLRRPEFEIEYDDYTFTTALKLNNGNTMFIAFGFSEAIRISIVDKNDVLIPRRHSEVDAEIIMEIIKGDS